MRPACTRLLAAAAALVLAGPAALRAQKDAAPFPHDAKKEIDNGYFVIWDATYQPGKSTGMARLPLDQVAIFLTDGPLKYTRGDGSWTIEHHKVGSVRWVSKGTSESAEAVGDAPVRAKIFQLTDKLPPKVAMPAGMPDKFPRDHAIKLFENDRAWVYDYTWKTGMVTKKHLHYHMDAGVWLANGQTCVGDEKPSERVFGEVIGGGKDTRVGMEPHQERHCGTKGEARAITIVLKNDDHH